MDGYLSKRVSATSKKYQLMNLLGSLGVMVNVFVQQAMPALALEVIWFLIAIYGLIKAFKK